MKVKSVIHPDLVARIRKDPEMCLALAAICHRGSRWEPEAEVSMWVWLFRWAGVAE